MILNDIVATLQFLLIKVFTFTVYSVLFTVYYHLQCTMYYVHWQINFVCL